MYYILVHCKKYIDGIKGHLLIYNFKAGSILELLILKYLQLDSEFKY